MRTCVSEPGLRLRLTPFYEAKVIIARVNRPHRDENSGCGAKTSPWSARLFIPRMQAQLTTGVSCDLTSSYARYDGSFRL
jgi:hypothetical protein